MRSHCDGGPYHGWLFAYDAATFVQKSVYVTTPNGGLGGFWMSGAGVAADASGNIFIASGNGDFDTTNVPAKETSDTILKLGTTNQILTQLDYFTPKISDLHSQGTRTWGREASRFCPTSQDRSRTFWWKREKRESSTSSTAIR